jgi:hypothetical protein
MRDSYIRFKRAHLMYRALARLIGRFTHATRFIARLEHGMKDPSPSQDSAWGWKYVQWTS